VASGVSYIGKCIKEIQKRCCVVCGKGKERPACAIFVTGWQQILNVRKERPDISLGGRCQDILIDLLGTYRNGAGVVGINTSKTSLKSKIMWGTHWGN